MGLPDHLICILKNLYAGQEATLRTLCGRSSGEENGNPVQYLCLENTMERGAWFVAMHGVTKSCTRLRTYARLSVHVW